MNYPDSFLKLIEALMRLPGIGPKSAQRVAFYLINQPEFEAKNLVTAIEQARAKIRNCRICFNISDGETCKICDDPARDRSIICVVESPKDLIAIERSSGFKGLYHVLGGAISPIDGIGPDDIRLAELVERIKSQGVREIIVATDPDMEGETTALYLAKVLKPLNVKVTRIAHGLPVGGNLEYADDLTLYKALEGRREM